ncbi:MAG: glycerol-3-phosphate dehydrogenase/oxidase, partial [Acidobacteriota bacterium]
RSSKLIHGGLRYLKQMQFRITRLACRERDRMLTLDPHLVRSINCVYPAYEGDRTPGWQVDLGLWMYDRLTGRPEKHRQLSRKEITGLAPGLRTDELDRALAYTDGVADDARLTLAVAATAHAYGAAVLPRAEVEGALRNSEGRITGLLVKDLENDRVVPLEARVVINAAGVWTDAVRFRLGLEGTRLRPSRGSHLILPRQSIQLEAAVTFPAPDDGRPVFLIPHPEGLLLGTTDLFHSGDLDDPRPSRKEVAYLMRAVRAAFPSAQIEDSTPLGAFAGLRPILDTYADNPSEASREEDIWEEQGLLSVSGGKLTTWRSTAEEAIDAALNLMPEEHTRSVSPCATKGTPLAGLCPVDLAARMDAVDGLEPVIAAGMARRLGGLAWHTPLLARTRRDLQPLDGTSDLCLAEVRAHLRWGGVLHLDDLLLRRVRMGLWDPAAARELVPMLESVVRREMGWGRRRWAKEEAAFIEALTGWTVEGIREDS